MKKITCITCPISCRIMVESANDAFIISGNKCQNGYDYAMKEMIAPVRTLTTTVRTVFVDMPVLPVKTNSEVPKEMILEIIHELADVLIMKNIRIGDIIVADILGTGCDIVATCAIE